MVDCMRVRGRSVNPLTAGPPHTGLDPTSTKLKQLNITQTHSDVNYPQTTPLPPISDENQFPLEKIRGIFFPTFPGPR